MKVLVVQPHGLWPGPSSFAEQFCQALASEGHEVALVTARGLVTATGKALPWKHIQALPPEAMRSPGASRGAGYFRARSATVQANWAAVNLALKLAKREGFGAVHVLDSEPLSLAMANLRRGRPRNLFVTYRGYEFGTGAGPPLTRLYQVMRRAVWRCTASNIWMDAETSQSLDAAVRSGAVRRDRIRLIPHPIWSPGKLEGLDRQEARKRIGVDWRGPLFLLFGHRPPMQKALDVVIEAISNMPRTFRLLIAGREGDAAADALLVEHIRAAGWDADVYRHFDYVPAEKVESYFAASDALILSYRKEYIGASGVLAQACAYGLPVIASDAADLGETVRSKRLGLVFKAEDSESLREAMKRFMGLPETALSEYRQALASIREERSWRNVVRQHLQSYESAGHR